MNKNIILKEVSILNQIIEFFFKAISVGIIDLIYLLQQFSDLLQNDSNINFYIQSIVSKQIPHYRDKDSMEIIQNHILDKFDENSVIPLINLSLFNEYVSKKDIEINNQLRVILRQRLKSFYEYHNSFLNEKDLEYLFLLFKQIVLKYSLSHEFE